ncbi:MAG: type II toxin-antitoxin system RelE/ParE family toxin [Acetobacteraceae bacterium]
MPTKLDYTDDAIEDLKAIRRWLTQPGSGPRARRRLRAIRAAIARLREHPCLYPIGQHPGLRERPCDGGYRATYEIYPERVRDETARDVLVLRVFGPGPSCDRF